MALNELVPTLESIQDNLAKIANTVEETDNNDDLRRAHPNFGLGTANSLRDLAREFESQVRTAKRTFTLAVVGEFKVGKSTLLNALLGLAGDNALSAQDDPDTACSILLRYRGNEDPEARLHFEDGRSEDTTWDRARGFTSQVWLDKNNGDANHARHLVEVEYFIRSEVLAAVNVNDLPGTGSRYWKEHTELTHRKMKEADAILWVVGDMEPTMDSKRDLDILAECSRHVFPIVNVFEDPTADPPWERDQSTVDAIVDILKRRYSHCFSPETPEPLQIASRVLELERAKSVHDPLVLERSGWTELVSLQEKLQDLASDPKSQGRLDRLMGVSRKLGNDAIEKLIQTQTRAEDFSRNLKTVATKTSVIVDDIDDIHSDVRARIRKLAKEYSRQICKKVSGLARDFVEDTLQLSNVTDMVTLLKSPKNGRDNLENALRERFLSEYLMLNKEPNWLQEITRVFGEDVKDVVLPAWKRHLRKFSKQIPDQQSPEAPEIRIETLGDNLLNAIFAVLRNILGILAVAGLLAAIPGGAIIDAVAIVGLLVLSAVTDPLAGSRRRAVDRVRLQVDSQQYEVQNRLLQAGMDGNSVIQNEVSDTLIKHRDQASENLLALRGTITELKECEEKIEELLKACDFLETGGAL